MDSARWSLIETIFAEACARAPDGRDEYLDAACGGNPELRKEVEELLRAEEASQQLFTLLSRRFPSASALGEDAELPPVLGLKAGPYVLESPLGSGGMGQVFAARRDDDQYAKRVAVKMIRFGFDEDHMVRRFRRERQILAALEHPNIARLIDGGVLANGCPYMVMELVEGERIDAWLTRHGVRGQEVLPFMIPILRALEYAHSNLVVHCDIKPSNIMVTSEGVPKLLDFGVARLLRDDNSDVTSLALTPRYAAPEVSSGQLVTVAGDVYSLGVLLRELCGPLDPRSDLQCILAKASEKEAAGRYPSVEALRGDIERLLAGYPILARRGAAWYKAKKFLSRNRAPAITGALAVLGLSAALLYAWDQARTAKRRYSDTRALARTMMFDAHDAVMELPGSTPVQRLLIDRSLSYFERLAAESGGDPEVLAELAEGYGRLGELMGSPYRPNTGDSARAAETIRRGLKLVEAGTGEAAQKARARLQTTLSEVLSISDPTAALAAIRAAVAMHEQIVARFPSAGNRLELMSAYGSLGDALEGEDALTAQERSLQAARAVLAIEPQNARARRGVAIGLYKMGDASFKLHRYRQALSLAREAILALEVSLADSVPMKRMKAAALQLTGESQRELGAPLEGIAPIEQAIAIHEGLQRRDPANQQPVISLAIMHRAQGDNWSAAGERAKARAAYRRSRELLESVMRVDPGNAVWRGRLAEIRELESRVM